MTLENLLKSTSSPELGGWSLALRKAGWPDDRRVWTASCPCQPFSPAGKKRRFTDERHLWPHVNHLVSQCQPSVVFGEQVASKDGLAWLDLVYADLEAAGYASGAVDLCAAGIGAPHIRQRLWWVGSRVGHANDTRPQGHGQSGNVYAQAGREAAGRCSPAPSVDDGLADTDDCGHWLSSPAHGSCEGHAREAVSSDGGFHERLADNDRRPGPTNGFWRDADWLFCRDGKWRPVEPGTSPLAHGSAARVGRLRGYGNAIVAPAAQVFIEAVMESM